MNRTNAISDLITDVRILIFVRAVIDPSQHQMFDWSYALCRVEPIRYLGN